MKPNMTYGVILVGILTNAAFANHQDMPNILPDAHATSADQVNQTLASDNQAVGAVSAVPSLTQDCQVSVATITCTEELVLQKPTNQPKHFWIKAADMPPAGNIHTDIFINDIWVPAIAHEWQQRSAYSATDMLRLKVVYTVDAPKAGDYRMPSWKVFDYVLGSPDSQHSIGVKMGFSKATQPVICALDKQSQSVTLENVASSQLRHQGNKVKAGSFVVGLTCNSDSPQIAMAMTDVTQPSNTSDLLSISTERASAKGLALQLKRSDDQNVSFTPQAASFEMPAANQWYLQAKNSTPNQQFDVYYVNTQGQVTAGKVEAKATVTVAFR